MNELLLLLAQTPYENRLKGLQSAFKGRKQDPADVKAFFSFVLVFAGIAAALVIIHVLRERRKRRDGPGNPMKLFNTVLRRLKLRPRQRWLLAWFARATQLPQPTVLLLNERLFDRHAEAHLERIGLRALRKASRAAIEALRARAFVEDDTRPLAEAAGYGPVNSA